MVSHDGLNAVQQQAVLHGSGPVLVLAGAGSGKTRVITHRIAELVRRGVKPHRILAVTFTNKAAQEMRHRVEQLLPGASQGLWMGTFHSVCARLLRIHAQAAGFPKDFLVFDDHDQKTLCTQLLKEHGWLEHMTPRAVMSEIDQAKQKGIGPADYKGRDYRTDRIVQLYAEYQQRLRAASAMDFGDLLLLPLTLGQQNEQVRADLEGRFDCVLVDEFQDVNWVQYQLVWLWAHRTRQLMVVGDDDQSIYGWRGADVRNMLAFERDWPEAQVIKLEENYRSTAVILGAANAVIAKNRDRLGKQLFTSRIGGALIECRATQDEQREAAFVVETLQRLEREGVLPTECAILYRTHAQSRVLEEALRWAGMAYVIIGGMRFYDRAEVRDVLAYLRLCHNPHDEIALRRVINVPTRGIGDATLAKVEAVARAQQASLWQGLQTLLQNNELSGAIRGKLVQFVELVERLRVVSQQQGLAALAEAVVDETRYLERLALERTPEATTKRENVMELLQSIRNAVNVRADAPLTLAEYLEHIALISATDTDVRGVSLMTIHAAKGLEFRAVFVMGMEEGLFPSLRESEEARGGVDPIEEERRLAYVALTRAKERLFLSYAQTRRLYGALPRVNDPSRFLLDIPKDFLSPQSVHGRGGRMPRRSTWEEPASWDAETTDGSSWYERAAGPMGSQQNAVSSTDEPRVEYEDGPRARGGFRLGQVVHHVQFGRGTVRSFSGAGEHLKLVVMFDNVGPKTILARFVRV